MSLSASPTLMALGWTLVHTLWEGLILGLLGWGLLRLTRYRPAAERYLIACSVLVLMMLVFLGTAWIQFQVIQEPGAGIWLRGPVQEINAWAAGPGRWILPRLERSLPFLAVAWTAGACFMGLRTVLGLGWLHFACLRKARPVEEVWDARLRLLARELGMARAPRMKISDRVDTPLVLGWIRPVILVPSAVLAGMEPTAFEAVLLHELAHIRRWDYPVNLLQSLSEVIFFYHPALWWLSRQIRRERENCCDDVAASRCGDPLRYASALAALESIRISPTHSIRLAPAAKGGSLMLRVQRLITPEAASVSGPSLLSIASSLALGATLVLMALPLQARKADEPQTVQAVVVDFAQVKIKHQPPPPEYPQDAKDRGIQGTVVVRVTIGTDGLPKTILATSGPEELRECATTYASQWAFEPVEINGQKVMATFELTMPFRLR